MARKVWQRLCLSRFISDVDARCKSATGLGLSEIAQLYDRGILDTWLTELTERERQERRVNRTKRS
jgi:hypothetical protein